MVLVPTLALFLLSLLNAVVWASPTPHLPRQAITTLSPAQIASYKPFTWYASAAHCPANLTATWSCGASCQANPTFIPTASGGDGDATQFWYVGYDPTHRTVIVGHQGTNTSEFLPLLTDAEFFQGELDTTLFPGVNSSVRVHDGFRNEHARTATTILSAVQRTMSQHSVKHVTLVGHSLGAALALLDSVYLPLHLPAGTTFSTYGYGTPRVGNEAFANYVDSHVTNLSRVNNKEDPVPTLPGRFLGYHHPSGEKHIMDNLAWVACPGQDNTSKECSTGDVPTILESNTHDHSGPYDGVIMGTGC